MTFATAGFMAEKLGFFMMSPFTVSWLLSQCKGFHEFMIGCFYPDKIGEFRLVRND